MTIDVRPGDCLDVLRAIPDASIAAVVTDPPYGLSALKPAAISAALVAWASGDREQVPNSRGFMGRAWDAFVPPPAVWDECYRVLKPGGHLVAFAGSRTYDLMGVSIRLAGFEVRDGLQWLYGSGMPKGTAQLKPACEPMALARKPFAGSAKACVAEYGTGVFNIDACRTEMSEADREAARVPQRATHGYSQLGDGVGRNGQRFTPAEGGRWPANVLLDEATADAIGEQARYFYCAKATKAERPKVDGQGWPTVKPLALMRWLVRLVTPEGGTVLDPFSGTGTTLQAAALEGFNAIGIERDELALRLIEERLREAA